jgi:hypothetical protein
VQYVLLDFTILQVLEGPIHGGNELDLSNCNEGKMNLAKKKAHTKTTFSTDTFAGAKNSAVQ